MRLLERNSKDSIDDPDAYVAKIAGNLSISSQRKLSVRQRVHADQAVRDLLAPFVPCPHEVLDARERLNVVKSALAELPPRAREVFLANRVDGKSYSRIALEMEISVSAVEKNMARALTQLSLKLNELRRRRDRG